MTDPISNERLAEYATNALDNLRVHQRQLDAEGCEVGVSREALNEVIRAFGELSLRASEPGVRGKDLRWRKSNVAARWTAEHPWGEYEIICNTRDVEYWSPQLGGVGVYWNTLEEAKAAAQQDYNRRILCAIDHVPGGEAQCCMCGKKGLSTVEGDGGTECQLEDGRWTCSQDCWERAVDPLGSGEPVAWIEREALAELARHKTASATVASPLLRKQFGDKVPLYPAPQPKAVTEEMVELAVSDAEIEWEIHEDNDRAPRDFWHARLNWRGLQSEWVQWDELGQHRDPVPDAEKLRVETELRNDLRAALTAALSSEAHNGRG